MSETPKRVLRKNPKLECGELVGQLAIKIKKNDGFEIVSFYCNKTRLHTDRCSFVGSEVEIIRKERPIIINSLH